jgi:hypothetical protein
MVLSTLSDFKTNQEEQKAEMPDLMPDRDSFRDV